MSKDDFLLGIGGLIGENLGEAIGSKTYIGKALIDAATSTSQSQVGATLAQMASSLNEPFLTAVAVCASVIIEHGSAPEYDNADDLRDSIYWHIA